MRRVCWIAAGLLTGLVSVFAAEIGKAPAQAERGRTLFLSSPKGTACGTCHALDGSGTAVGPDLRKLASVVGPRGIVSAIEMTVTAYVQEVKTSNGSFPGLLKQKNGEQIEMWDLSRKPPELRTLESKQILSTSANRTWKHPPASAGYTSQELADLIGFLKWASTGTGKEIDPKELDPR